jgi:hypothetical protein
MENFEVIHPSFGYHNISYRKFPDPLMEMRFKSKSANDKTSIFSFHPRNWCQIDSIINYNSFIERKQRISKVTRIEDSLNNAVRARG